MAKIYLSATRLDLLAECAAVENWLTNAGHEPIGSYGPDSRPVLESCLADVEGCDLYVLIQGYRYGGRPTESNPDNLSYTHLEYRHAGQHNIPRIVLQSSSIPNVEFSDIFDSAEMEAVKAFQSEVRNEVRPARFSSREELIEKLRAGIAGELTNLGLSLGLATLIEPFRRASRDLLTWPSTLSGDKWLARPELEQLCQRITESSCSVTLVLGEPGCGKSALLARLGLAMQKEGIPVLGIKADFLPEDVLTPQSLMQYLELPVSVLAAVQWLAEEGPVLVLLDQLDALAELVVQHSARLRVLLNLIRDLNDIHNVHVVATCRSFEQHHDPSLRNLDVESLTMALPGWEEVDAVLQSNGVQAGAWAEEMRETLLSPQALDTFLSLLGGTDELSLLHSYQGMLQIQWEKRVLCDGNIHGRKALLFDLARSMAEREMLWLPLARFEDRFELVKELVAANLLRMEEGTGRIGFRHQTLYEFVRVHSFLDVEGSLTEVVLAGQNSLRVRPQLWHALGHLRDVAPNDYQEELSRLWASDLRPHLRMLIIEFLGRQTKPLNSEVRLAFQSFDDPWFQRRFLNAASGSPGWFAQLTPNHLPMLMARPIEEAAIVQPIIGQAMGFAPQEALALVDVNWLPHPSRDAQSWQVLVMGGLPPQDRAWVDRIETMLSRTDFATWAVGHVAGIVSTVLPEEAPRLVAAWMRHQWQMMQMEKTPVLPADDETEALDKFSSPRDRMIESLLHCRDLHDLAAIAEAAPFAFIHALWVLYMEMLYTVTSDAHPFVVGYRDSHVLFEGLGDEEDSRLDHPMPEAISLAIDAWAEADPEAFLEFVRSNDKVDMLIVQRWLARGLVKCAAHDPAFVLEFLCADPRRLALGPHSNNYRDSQRLIQAVAPHLDEAQYLQLENTLRNWHHYRHMPDDDAHTKKNRLLWDRQNRLRLLRALPAERLNPAIRRLVEEEERAFPNLSDRDMWFSGMSRIDSPVSADQMQKAQDEDILHLFAELTDNQDRRHPRQDMKGGAIEAGRELAKLAEANAERAVRLVRNLQPGRNEIPVGQVLRNLVKAGYGREALYALIEELNAKGFNSNHFRHEAAHAIEEAASAEALVPESLLELLASWLVSVDPTSEDVAGEQKAKEHKQSLLWGHGGMVILPSGNYPALSAISRACLVVTPPLMDRWLDVLEGHLSRSESPRIWATVAWRYLRWLRLASHDRAQLFLDRLFHAYPSVLGRQEGIHLLAYIQHWMSPEHARNWLDIMAHEGGDGAQGYGELLMVRHALFPNEDYPKKALINCLSPPRIYLRALRWLDSVGFFRSWLGKFAMNGIDLIFRKNHVVALLDSTDKEALSIRTGIAHALVQLWSEPDHRNLAHGYLLPLLGSKENDVLYALTGIFRTQSWFSDQQTRELLDALCEHPAILRMQPAEFLVEHLEYMVEQEPERVARLANILFDQVGEAMGNIATSWYLRSESLLAIALALQDMVEPHRTNGLALFERMLEFNLPQANEMVLSLDKRTPQGAAVPSVRRRRRNKGRKT
ncbi:MAG: DUF4062 domain-containing protein [Sideroxydans sp.]|nr:DUF4062 domain-containing protein [Sideroxydans sp.]